MTDTATMRLAGIAVPFNQPELVGDRGADGKVAIFRETFDEQSFRNLPPEVPMCRRHDDNEPIAWCKIRNTNDGMHIDAELIEGSGVAKDTYAAVRAGLLSGLSVSFAPSDSDVWTPPGPGEFVPSVLRRGASLRHIAVVNSPAFRSARVSVAGLPGTAKDRDLSDWGPFQPLLDARIAEAKQQRANDIQLLEQLDHERRQREAAIAAKAAAATATEPWHIKPSYAGTDVVEWQVPRSRCNSLAEAQQLIDWTVYRGSSVTSSPGDIDAKLRSVGVVTIRKNQL